MKIINNLMNAAKSFFSATNLKSRYQMINQTLIKNPMGPPLDKFNLSDIECFMNLVMKDEIIQQFLDFDRCYKLADRYLLSLVFIYFIRARLDHSEYTRINFFAALHLAHDIEEEEDILKDHIVRWGLPIKQKHNKEHFLDVRNTLWTLMNFRASVSANCCLQVMQIKESPLWNRQRHPAHAGACRDYLPDEECSHCKPKLMLFFDTDSDIEEPCESSDKEDDIFEPPLKRLKLSQEE